MFWQKVIWNEEKLTIKLVSKAERLADAVLLSFPLVLTANKLNKYNNQIKLHFTLFHHIVLYINSINLLLSALSFQIKIQISIKFVNVNEI